MAKLQTKDVDVTVRLDLNHTPEFYFETNLPMKGHDHLTFKKGKKDGFLVNYTLDDPDHLYSFGSDMNQALYSTSQAVCPSGSGQWPEFTAQEITNGGLTLVVHNANESKMDFGYALRITRDGGQTYKDLDPIGTNENGNLKSSILVATAATVTGAAVGYALTQTVMTAATTMSALTGAVLGGLVGLVLYYAAQGFRG